MRDDIQKLIDLTTILNVEDTQNRVIFYGNNFPVSRFQKDQGDQRSLSDIEELWNLKWKSSNDIWTKELQRYRFLYESFLLFYLSFEQLRCHKVQSINIRDQHDAEKRLHYNRLCGLDLYGVYHHGKKCSDLLQELKLIDESTSDFVFCKKFSETRNKLIEHNHNPFGLDLQIEPTIWSLIGTDSFIRVIVHNKNEGAYEALVDYYEDYYQMENILFKTFSLNFKS